MDALRGVERRRNSQFDGAGTVHLTEWVQYNRPVSLTDAIQLAEDHLLMSMAALLSPSPSTFLALTSHPPTIAVLLTFLSGISHCSLSLKSLIQCGALGNAQLVMVRCMQGDPVVPLINFGDKSSFMWEKLQKYFCDDHSLISGTSSVQV